MALNSIKESVTAGLYYPPEILAPIKTQIPITNHKTREMWMAFPNEVIAEYIIENTRKKVPINSIMAPFQFNFLNIGYFSYSIIQI